MKTYQLIFMGIILFLLIIMGCSDLNKTSGGVESSLENANKYTVSVTKNPDAEEILTKDPSADIFQFDGLIYMTGIDWVEELTLTKDELVGEIKTKNDKDTNFEDGMANKLPVGAKIYSTKDTKSPILLVESEGVILKYYALIEG